MEVSEIIELMRGVSENGLTDFSYEENGVSIKIKKHFEKKVMPSVMPMQAELNGTAVEMSKAESQTAEITGNKVKSPLVGTFYAAGAPDADPFVRVGDVVSKGQTLGIVEAMKLMNEIESEYDGVVKAILVNNGELVEFDQPMFVIE